MDISKIGIAFIFIFGIVAVLVGHHRLPDRGAD